MKDSQKKRTLRALQELNLVDDFLFSKVMANEDICRPFLEKILKVDIRNVTYIETQKTLGVGYESKGVRFDVYLTDENNTVYEVEMQSGRDYFSPKRTRYYQGCIDFDFLKKGMPYGSLPKSYIIFICPFDCFGSGRHIYTFENLCMEDNRIRLCDETQCIILNTRGTENDVDEELRELLRYLENSTEEIAQAAGSPLVRRIHEQVREVKENRRLGVEFVTYEEHLMQERLEGKDEGKAEGIFLAKRVFKLDLQGLSVSEIAAECGVEENEVKRILE